MKYVRYALFRDLSAARAAVQDIRAESQDLKEEEVILTLHQDKVVEDDLRPAESDGRRGLFIGIATGAITGLILGLLLASVSVLPLSFPQAALFGLFLGSVIGGVGGGLYGTGLPAEPLKRLEKRWRRGNVLLTAEVEGAQRVAEVERTFKKHHAVVAAG